MSKILDKLLEMFAFPLVQLPLHNGSGNSTGLKALYRHDPEKNYGKNWLGYHTTDYIMTTNQKLIEAAFGIVHSMDLEVTDYDKKNSWISNDSRRMNLSLIINTDFTIGNDDRHQLTINLKNSYDGSFAYNADFGTYRLVCSNGAFIGKILARYKHKHLVEFSPDVLKHKIMIAVEKFPKLKDVYEKMKDSELTKTELDHIFEQMEKRNLTNKSDSENMSDLIGVERNTYALMTIFTYYLTHVVKSREKATQVNKFLMERLGAKYV